MSRIALIGLDGSGKSANLNKIKKDLDFKEYIFLWVRWKPYLLRPLYWVYNTRILKIQEKVIFRHDEYDKEYRRLLDLAYNKKAKTKSKIFRNPLVRNIWMLLATIDYFIQFYSKTLFCTVINKNIIYDRFYLDLYIDQGISFGLSPEQIRREILKHQWLFPKINQYLYIRVNPKICYERKNDIPNMDYLNQRFVIYELLSKDQNWTIIDGEQPFEKVNTDIKYLILNKE